MAHHDSRPSGILTDQLGGLQALTPIRLDRLQRVTGYPMVSVLTPSTPGARMAPQDRVELDRLLHTVETRLALEFDGPEIRELTDPLRVLAAELADTPARHGLALYHGAGILEAYQLSHRPVARVVIDPTFATRDVVRDQLDNPPYRLLVLSASAARLHIGSGVELTEHTRAPFPISADEPPPDRRGHLHQAVRTHTSPRRWDSFLRVVDNALRADRATSTLPLVLAAAEPLASRLPTRSSQPIIGVVTGNHEHTRPSRLAELAQPIVAAHLARQRQETLDDLERAASQRRAAFGVQDVWTAARDRRVVRLVVDPNYAQPATTTATDARHITPAPDPDRPEVLDDAVDDIIETVARHGGAIRFVPLSGEQGRIAAVLRTRERKSA